MSFTFPCPHCQQKLEADEALIGQTLNCPSCGKTIVINDGHADKLNSVDLGDDISTENEKVQIPKPSVTKIDRVNNHKETNNNTINTICLIFSSISLCLSVICLYYIVSMRHTDGLSNISEEKTVKSEEKTVKSENNSYLSHDQMAIWKAQPTPAFFNANPPSKTIELVVFCKLDDYYGPLLALGVGKAHDYSIRCSTLRFTKFGRPDIGESYGWAYISKSSDAAKRLIEVLKDGKSYIATVKIECTTVGIYNIIQILDVKDINSKWGR